MRALPSVRMFARARVALLIEHAKDMPKMVIYSLSGATTFFDIIPQTTRFSEKSMWNVECVFWFSVQILCKIFLIIRRIQRDVIINVKSLHVKLPLFLSDFNEIWIFSTVILKNSLSIKFNQKPSSGSPAVWCGRTDMTKLFENLRTRQKNAYY